MGTEIRWEMEGRKTLSAESYWAKHTIFRSESLKATQTGIPANNLGIACRPFQVDIGLNGDPIERGYQGSSKAPGDSIDNRLFFFTSPRSLVLRLSFHPPERISTTMLFSPGLLTGRCP